MSEQATEKKSSAVVKTGVKIIIGAALIILGILAVIGWRWYLIGLIKGGIGLVLIMAGAITIAIAKE